MKTKKKFLGFIKKMKRKALIISLNAEKLSKKEKLILSKKEKPWVLYFLKEI